MHICVCMYTTLFLSLRPVRSSLVENAVIICLGVAEVMHRHSNLCLYLRSDSDLHDNQNLNIKSFIGSDTLINCSLKRDRNHISAFFSSCIHLLLHMCVFNILEQSVEIFPSC